MQRGRAICKSVGDSTFQEAWEVWERRKGADREAATRSETARRLRGYGSWRASAKAPASSTSKEDTRDAHLERRVVGPDQALLVAPAVLGALGLRERKASRPAQPLRRADLLDRLLEPGGRAARIKNQPRSWTAGELSGVDALLLSRPVVRQTVFLLREAQGRRALERAQGAGETAGWAHDLLDDVVALRVVRPLVAGGGAAGGRRSVSQRQPAEGGEERAGGRTTSRRSRG